MKKTKLDNIGNILRLFMQMFFVFGILVLIFLYFITNYFGIHFDCFTLMVYPCGLLFLYLVYEFINMFKSLEENKPFSMDNVKRLRRSMYITFSISILVIIALLIASFAYSYYSAQLKVALLFISVLFFGVGIAFYILSELFRQATLYKEENDLTI